MSAPEGNAGRDDFLVNSLVDYYYRHVPLDEIADRSARDLVGAVQSHLDLGEERPPGKTLVRVLTPEVDSEGWTCDATVVEVVTDDMPFLVDSVSSEINRLGRPIRLVIHPVLTVRRNLRGSLLEVLPGALDHDARERADPDLIEESWIHVEIGRGAVPAEEIEAAIRRVLSDVREAVEDWPRMRAKAVSLADELRARRPASVGHAECEESAAFLDWLSDDNFTFLGYREYDLTDHDGGEFLRAVPGTGLGILRSDQDQSAERVALTPEVLQRAREPRILVLTTANSRSTVHRPAYLDYVGVKRFDDEGRVTGERRFLGLYAASAYSHSVREIPLLRKTVDEVIDQTGFSPRSHSGKDVLQFLETYPRDELFQVGADELTPVAVAVHQIAERRQTRLFVRRDPYGRFMSCLVYLPRDRYTTMARLEIQDILMEAFGGDTIDYTARVSESVLARLHFVVRAVPGQQIGTADTEEVLRRIEDVVRSWDDDLEDELRRVHGEEQARELQARYAEGFPESYMAEVPAVIAVKDIRLAGIADDEGNLQLRLYDSGEDPRARRLKLLRAEQPISLSQVLPLLNSLGVDVVDEHPHTIERTDRPPLYVCDFGFLLPPGEMLGQDSLRERFEAAFRALWQGQCEADSLNALVVTAGMSWRQVTLLRCYVRYLQQAGSTFGVEFMESTLVANSVIARHIVDLFEARFDPDRDPGREEEEQRISGLIDRELDSVSSLDQDRILRSITTLVRATLRTNAYVRDEAGDYLDRLSIKLDPQRIPDLPLPRPRFEIWVYSPRVEGVHLRFGRVARGGLRWSDRRADFRTEVLGLVKAQQVKNAVIVPVGAKGGFLPKSLPDPSVDRDAWLEEGRGAYATFVRGMLDVTDNRVEGRIVPPPSVVRHDGDDPYLVVAADKGTATFSDLANSVAAEYDFWLGDAFASGGSQGYDHKAMGITAKGAWISVQRHFREMGIDVQDQDFTVVGVGDMSGDVFGNGMLLSPHIRLVAAFDHRHIFLDPDPDAVSSFAERERLFALPRSSWADYDRGLISAGGGVYDRSAKGIEITPQVRAALGIADDRESMVPADLIRHILTAPVDLLWNGGIGTYVKAQTETNADVGDKANDAVRVNGTDLRCQVVGEGGNLGFTQLGRVEAARHGVRLNTDAIDNSAGVDTSDHEVNIKILLDGAVRDGDISEEERNALLVSMTDEVADLVLRDNYEQNVLLGNARAMAPALISVHARFIADLEQRGLLDRAIEFLPDDEELATRAAAGQGLTSPELAVLAAYSKIWLMGALEESDLASDPWFGQTAVSYFPQALQAPFAERIQAHPLRDDIITTVVVNDLINNGGTSMVFRAGEETGASPLEVVRAASATIAIFDLPDFWRRVDELDNLVPTAAQTALYLESRRLLDRATRWLLQTRGGSIDVGAEVARFQATIRDLASQAPQALVGVERERLEAAVRRFEELGAPPEMAREAAGMLDVYALLDVVQVAERAGEAPAKVMEMYFALSERYDVDRLLVRITALPRGDRWTALARQALRTDLYGALAGLVLGVLRGTSPEQTALERIESWEARNAEGLARAKATLDQVSAQEHSDLATLSVALRVMRNLVAQGRSA